MRTTIFAPTPGGFSAERSAGHAWRDVSEWDGQAVSGTQNVEIHRSAHGVVVLVRIRAGGRFPMHAGSVNTVCQIVRGRGTVGLPNGHEAPYDAPELFIFEPGALHAWNAEKDTEFTVCEIR
jgi:quercetin dioxygenase-like cupin family protein